MANEKAEVVPLNVNKLSLAADYYTGCIPGLSRVYIKELDKIKQDWGLSLNPVYQSCRFCGSVFRPGNHKIKFLKKMRLNKKIKKLLQRKEEKGEHNLGKFQRKLVDGYLNSTTRVVIVCGICKKKTVIACPCKPEKISLKEIKTDVKSTKAAKKKMKQKKRRLEKYKEKDHCGRLNTLDKQFKHDGIVLANSKLDTTAKVATLQPVIRKQSQSKLPSIVDTQSKKKKGKNFSQTLQKMLNKEEQNSTGSKSSLQSFLSHL